MLISGTETSHAPTHATTVPSAAITEDGQSVRQPNPNTTITAATSEAPTGFRNPAAVDRGTVSSQRRGNLVLYVKSNDNESDGQPRGATNALMLSQQNGGASSDNSQGEHKDEDGDGEREDLVSLVVSTLTNTGSSVMNTVTGVAHKPLLTTAIVLLYVILLDIVLLTNNELLNRVLRRVSATDNDALVLLSASLMRQMKEARRDLHDTLAMRNPPTALERLETVQRKALALERVCNRSLARLHMRLLFPGSVDDLTFLIEQHVDFDAQLQKIAGEELEWARTVLSSSVVHMRGGVPEGQRFLLGSHAAIYNTVGSGDSNGNSGGATSLDAVERHGSNGEDAEEAADAQSNPLRNVRLERVKKTISISASAASRLPTQTNAHAARAAAAAAKQRQLRLLRKDKDNGAALEEEMEEEEGAGGLLSLLKNKYVAFMIICVLIAAVLRMG
jgi:hypothetical protein